MPSPREGSFLETLCFMNQLPSFRFVKLTPPECPDTLPPRSLSTSQDLPVPPLMQDRVMPGSGMGVGRLGSRGREEGIGDFQRGN